jgi:hypothetical protein
MTAKARALKPEHRQQRVANATVQAKYDEFAKACLVKWLLRKHVTVAVERVRALPRHVLRARAMVASLKKFHIQSKFLPELTAVKRFDSQARVQLGSVVEVPATSSCICELPITTCISAKKTIW